MQTRYLYPSLCSVMLKVSCSSDAYPHTYLPTYLPTYRPTYLHIYVHTYYPINSISRTICLLIIPCVTLSSDASENTLPVPSYRTKGLCPFEIRRQKLAVKGRALQSEVLCTLGEWMTMMMLSFYLMHLNIFLFLD